jgi:hypothetical protein
MNLAQRRTLDWFQRTRPSAAPSDEAMVVALGSGQGYTHALIFENGSYCTVTLGQLRQPPKNPDRGAP